VGEQHDIWIGVVEYKEISCCFPPSFTLLLKGINGIAHSQNLRVRIYGLNTYVSENISYFQQAYTVFLLFYRIKALNHIFAKKLKYWHEH